MMDLHTLRVEHAALLALYTILTLVNSLLHRESKGIFWFPFYTLLAFIGAVLVAVHSDLPNSVSTVLGATIFPASFLFLNKSLTEFFGEGSGHGIFGWRVQLVFVLFASLMTVEFGFLHPVPKLRMVGYGITISLQLGLIAWLVFRNASGTSRIAGIVMGSILTMLSLNNLLRTIATLVAGSSPSLNLHNGQFLAWMMVDISALHGGITVAFIWMTAAAQRHNLQLQAYTDPLTGLQNRRAVTLAAERHILASRLHQQPLSAIMIDMDGFKQLNDTFGHAFGDAALVAVARCLQGQVRNLDVLARIGGDEFVVLLPGTPIKTAREVAERLRRAVENLQVKCGEKESGVSASFGVAQMQNQCFDWDHLITYCDKALYLVKSAGGNAVRELGSDLLTAQ